MRGIERIKEHRPLVQLPAVAEVHAVRADKAPQIPPLLTDNAANAFVALLLRAVRIGIAEHEQIVGYGTRQLRNHGRVQNNVVLPAPLKRTDSERGLFPAETVMAFGKTDANACRRPLAAGMIIHPQAVPVPEHVDKIAVASLPRAVKADNRFAPLRAVHPPKCGGMLRVDQKRVPEHLPGIPNENCFHKMLSIPY